MEKVITGKFFTSVLKEKHFLLKNQIYLCSKHNCPENIVIFLDFTRSFPVDTGRKLNIHNMFRRRPGRLLNVLCMFNLRPVSTGLVIFIFNIFVKAWATKNRLCHRAYKIFCEFSEILRKFLSLSIYFSLNFRSSHRRCSVRKGVLRNFTKFTEKHLRQSIFFNKVAGFPVNFAKSLRIPFLRNTSSELLLKFDLVGQ